MNMKNLKLFLLAGSVLAYSAPSNAKIIKNFDFENGLGPVVAKQISGCGTLSIANNVARTGKSSMKAHIGHMCGERAEATAFTPKLDQEYWVGWSVYVNKNDIKPGKFGFTHIQQNFNHSNTWNDNSQDWVCGNPRGQGTELYPDGSLISKVYYAGSGNRMECKKGTTKLKFGQWNDFVMNFRWSRSNNGFVRTWVNGEQILNFKGATNKQNSSTMGNPGYWKVGAYNGHPPNGGRTVYIDSIKVGDASSSYEEVAPKGAPAATGAGESKTGGVATDSSNNSNSNSNSGSGGKTGNNSSSGSLNSSSSSSGNNEKSDNGTSPSDKDATGNTTSSNSNTADGKNAGKEASDNATNEATANNDSASAAGIMLGDVKKATITNNYVYDVSTAFASSDGNMAGALSDGLIQNNTVLNTSDAAFGFDAPRTGTNNILFDSNILETKGATYATAGSDLRTTSFKNNCFSDAAPMPAEAKGNDNVSVELTVINPSMGIENPKNLKSTDNVCREMEAGVQGFQAMQLEPTDLSAERGTDGKMPADPAPEPTEQPQQPEQPTQPEAPSKPDVAQKPEQPSQPTTPPNNDLEAGEAAGGNNVPTEQTNNEAPIVRFIRELITSIVTAILNALFGLGRA